MSSIGTTPSSVNPASVVSNCPISFVNVHEQSSDNSELTTSVQAASVQTTSTNADSITTLSNPSATTIQLRNEDTTTSVPIGAFSLTLRNAGLGNLASSLGNDFVLMIEGYVQLTAHFLFRNSGAGNSHATADLMLSSVQIIQNQIEIWQRAHVGAHSIVVIDGRIIEMSINEEIERMQNSN